MIRRRRHAAFSLSMAVSVLSLLGAGSSLWAQHGHPLVGSWSGDWGPNIEQRHRVLLLLAYDGEAITGTINPGPNPIPLTAASLDPETWTVRLEADETADDGTLVHYVIEGTIENLGSITGRAIAGVWARGSERGDFRVVLN